MKNLFSLSLFVSSFLFLNAGEDNQVSKPQKEEQIVEMIKRYVENQTTSENHIISSDRTDASKKLLTKLQVPLTVEWNSKPLSEVCNDLRDFLGINIFIHKDINKDSLIDMKTKDMKGLNAIKWILRSLDLKGALVEGVLWVTPKDKAPVTDVTMVIYDISDITNTIKDFPANIDDIGNATGLGGGNHGLGK